MGRKIIFIFTFISLFFCYSRSWESLEEDLSRYFRAEYFDLSDTESSEKELEQILEDLRYYYYQPLRLSNISSEKLSPFFFLNPLEKKIILEQLPFTSLEHFKKKLSKEFTQNGIEQKKIDFLLFFVYFSSKSRVRKKPFDFSFYYSPSGLGIRQEAYLLSDRLLGKGKLEINWKNNFSFGFSSWEPEDSTSYKAYLSYKNKLLSLGIGTLSTYPRQIFLLGTSSQYYNRWGILSTFKTEDRFTGSSSLGNPRQIAAYLSLTHNLFNAQINTGLISDRQYLQLGMSSKGRIFSFGIYFQNDATYQDELEWKNYFSHLSRPLLDPDSLKLENWSLFPLVQLNYKDSFFILDSAISKEVIHSGNLSLINWQMKYSIDNEIFSLRSLVSYKHANSEIDTSRLRAVFFFSRFSFLHPSRIIFIFHQKLFY